MRPEALEAMGSVLEGVYGNPSGIHSVSQQAKNALEEAREKAAQLLGADRPLEIVFTGGGTEADNLAVAGAALAGGRRGGVVTTAVEHEAVLATGEFLASLGCSVEIVGVDSKGAVAPDEVADAVGSDTAVVSVMTANNEVGTLQPIRKIAEAVRGSWPNVAVHTDAAQAFVSEDVTVDALDVDLIALAAHKFGGPKGVGLLYVRDGIELEPVLHGGGQELGRRSGTHNVPGIVGMVAAMEAAVADRDAFRLRISAIRDDFEAAIRSVHPDVQINGSVDDRLVQHSHLRFPGVSAETLLIRLDQSEVAAAAGSACHSGAVEVSHVLAAMGIEPEAAGECVRFTFGWDSDAAQADEATALVSDIVASLR